MRSSWERGLCLSVGRSVGRSVGLSVCTPYLLLNGLTNFKEISYVGTTALLHLAIHILTHYSVAKFTKLKLATLEDSND